MEKIVRLVGLLCPGLLAGAFCYTVFTVVPTFYQVPREVHLTYRVALMRHNAIYMQLVMALSILTPALWAYTIRDSKSAKWCAIGASLSALTSLVVTRFGNVPLNRVMQTWPATAPPEDYLELLHRWNVFHGIRTATAVLSFLLVLSAEMLRDV